MLDNSKKSAQAKAAADESPKTQKARHKIKKKLDKLEAQITPKALKAKSVEIAEWIEKYSADRVTVQKDLSLFDQNRNSVKMSRSVEKLAQELALKFKEI